LLVPSLKIGGPRAAVIIVTIVLLAVIHYVGVRYGAASIYVFTLGKLVPLVGFIVIALVAWKSNPIPGSFVLPAGHIDWSSAALFMLFAYAGFENLGVPAGEYKNPRRDLPLALLVGILIIAAIYVLAQLGAMSALPDLSKSDTPIATAAAAIVGPIGAIVVTIGALLSMAGTNSGTMLEGSRMLWALAEHRRMGRVSYIHPRFHTPTYAIVIHAVVALVLALAGSFATLALVSAVARLTTYLVTSAAVPRLRKLNEGFRTPGLIVPILGVLASMIMVVALIQNPKRLVAGALAIIAGAIVYFVSTPRTPPVAD
jgi:amino acid transporter